jgi:O-antigen/teichoic acid export membrane protein
MVRWPIELYTGVFRGLERQTYLNAVASGASLVNALGAVIILVFVSRTLTGFLIWQVGGSALELAAMAWLSWKLLKGESKHVPVFDTGILKTIWRFSATMTGVSFLAIILKQLDKLIISKLLPLSQLGFYSAASAASQGLVNIINPISKASFPRFSSLIASGEDKALARTYHNASRSMAFGVTPAAMALIFFAQDILLVWTRSPAVAEHSHGALALLSLASLLNCFMGPAQSLNMASGHATIPLWTNLTGVLVLAPMSAYLITHYGILGAGYSWVVFNLGYFLIVPHFIHRRTLPGHLKSWYLKDILPFILLGLVLFPPAAWISSHWAHPWARLCALGATILIYGIIGVQWCPPAKQIMEAAWSRARRRLASRSAPKNR